MKVKTTTRLIPDEALELLLKKCEADTADDICSQDILLGWMIAVRMAEERGVIDSVAVKEIHSLSADITAQIMAFKDRRASRVN